MAYKSIKGTVQQLDMAQAWEKAKHYCAYQERCHSEVQDKLFGFGMNPIESAQLISRLIETNYLNEERFALQFAGGHFRTRKWGKIKIAHALKLKQVSAYCIKKALAAIDEDKYLALLQNLAGEKWASLKGGKMFERKFKCKQFLLQKGFESVMIDEALKIIEKEV